MTEKQRETVPEHLTLEEVIRNHIERVLGMTGYNQSQAARILGLPLSTLRSKIKKLGIETKPMPTAVSSHLIARVISRPTGEVSPIRNLH